MWLLQLNYLLVFQYLFYCTFIYFDMNKASALFIPNIFLQEVHRGYKTYAYNFKKLLYTIVSNV